MKLETNENSVNFCHVGHPWLYEHVGFMGEGWGAATTDFPGSAFIKPDQLDPRIKDRLGNALLSTILHLQ